MARECRVKWHVSCLNHASPGAQTCFLWRWISVTKAIVVVVVLALQLSLVRRRWARQAIGIVPAWLSMGVEEPPCVLDDGKPAANERHMENSAKLDVNWLEEPDRILSMRSMFYTSTKEIFGGCLDDLRQHLMTLVLAGDESKDEDAIKD